MLNWTAQDLAHACAGLLSAPPELPLSAMHFDSRQMQPGSVFVALATGARDGHDFVSTAFEQGAALALVQHRVDGPHVCVPDTLQALQAIARAHREAVAGRVFAITGSMGKTTTRRLLQAILSQRAKVLATEGNYNNHIGVPLTLCRYRDQQDVVLEMGANHQGEIGELRAIGRPHIVAITLAGRAHLEGFGGIEGVIQGKGEILDHLPAEGVAVLNAEDPAFERWSKRAGAARVVSFGEGGVVRAEHIQDRQFQLVIADQHISINLQLAGRHQINNALCAAAMAYADGVSMEHIRAGLESVPPEAGRGQRLKRGSITLIDDTYNANPDAMHAAVRALLSEDPQGIAVLGAMRELGRESQAAHHEVGAQARAMGLQHLWTMDPNIAKGFGPGAQVFADPESIQAALDGLEGQHRVLIKGSRGAAMERCFAHWKLGE